MSGSGRADAVGSDANGTLSTAFASSSYSDEQYSHWPLGRRVHAFLAEQSGIQDYESVFLAVYARALATRDKTVAAV